MRILGLDTSTNAVSAAIAEDERLLGQAYLHVTKKHSETLLPILDQLLTDCGYSIKDMDAVAVTAGPGSFTGVRIGVASASAFAYALSCPVYEVSTLDALLAMAPSGLLTCALLDARRDQVYVKAQDGSRIVIQESAQSLRDVLSSLAGCTPVLFTGDGACAHEQEIRAAMQGALFLPEAASYPTAAGACVCAAQAGARKRTHETVRPTYLRLPQAQRALQDKRKREGYAELSGDDTTRRA